MKRINILILFFSLIAKIAAQNISVSSFKLLDTDLTANTAGTMETDQNGETAALIKVVTTQTGFSFDGGALGIVKTVQKPSEIWVYVPRGLKKITISHPQLGMLRDYYLSIPIEAARTYEMVLVSGEVQTVVKESSRSQYLVIKVNPSNAIVELDNEILPTSDGVAQKFLKFGTYDYRIQAKDYHVSAGKVTIDNPKEKKVLTIELLPAFGWIEIESDQELNGAQVFIDNTLAGIIPFKSDNISSGRHNIKIVKPLYLAYEETISIQDNETKMLKPKLKSDFSIVTINVDDDAEIYINQELKGSGIWTGKLGTGVYVFEARKEGHRTTTITKDIISSQSEYKIQLEKPIPIYGEANITSNPTLSDVVIDGKEYGQTPLYLTDLLIGRHNYIIKHEGYGDCSGWFEIEENKTTSVNAELNNIVSITITCNIQEAGLYVDGEYKGRVGQTLQLPIGSHQIAVRPYRSNNELINYEKDINITGKDKELFINLNKYVWVSFNCDKPRPFFLVDGKLMEKDKNGRIKLIPGKHKLVIRHAGQDELSKELDISFENRSFYISFRDRVIIPQSSNDDADYLQQHTPKIETKTKEITKPVSPNDNTIAVSFYCDRPRPFFIIDGSLMEINSDGTIKLSPGFHELIIRHEGYDELRKTIEVNKTNTTFNISFRNRSINPSKK